MKLLDLLKKVFCSKKKSLPETCCKECQTCAKEEQVACPECSCHEYIGIRSIF